MMRPWIRKEHLRPCCQHLQSRQEHQNPHKSRHIGEDVDNGGRYRTKFLQRDRTVVGCREPGEALALNPLGFRWYSGLELGVPLGPTRLRIGQTPQKLQDGFCVFRWDFGHGQDPKGTMYLCKVYL